VRSEKWEVRSEKWEVGRRAKLYSLLPTSYSLLSTPYSLLPTPYSLLSTLYSLLPTSYSLLSTLYSLLPTSYSLPPMYTLIAPAKINLYLEIIGDRPDGFHELVMVLQSIDLGDRLTLDRTHSNSHHLTCNDPQLSGRDNLAYRAAELISERFPDAFASYGGVKIHLEKQIPVAAGLAGGSADGAAVLVGMNLLWNLGLTQEDLQTLAAQLGSDLPFCVTGGTAIATGRGEQLDFIHSPPEPIWLVLAKHRNLAISTPWAYQTYRQQFSQKYIQHPDEQAARAQRIHAGPMVGAIAAGNLAAMVAHLENDLEAVVLPAQPAVAQLREALLTAGAMGAMMSGSGPSVFALCGSPDHAEVVKTKTANLLKDPNLDFWVTQFSHQGIHLASLS